LPPLNPRARPYIAHRWFGFLGAVQTTMLGTRHAASPVSPGCVTPRHPMCQQPADPQLYEVQKMEAQCFAAQAQSMAAVGRLTGRLALAAEAERTVQFRERTCDDLAGCLDGMGMVLQRERRLSEDTSQVYKLELQKMEVRVQRMDIAVQEERAANFDLRRAHAVQLRDAQLGAERQLMDLRGELASALAHIERLGGRVSRDAADSRAEVRSRDEGLVRESSARHTAEGRVAALERQLNETRRELHDMQGHLTRERASRHEEERSMRAQLEAAKFRLAAADEAWADAGSRVKRLDIQLLYTHEGFPPAITTPDVLCKARR